MPRTFLISEEKLKFDRGERAGYLFDTNIWLHINPPIPRTSARDQACARVYTRLYKAILSSSQMIAQCDVVLAEYINRFIREQQREGGDDVQKYKVYRRSPEYRAVVTGLAEEICETMGPCKMTGWAQPTIDLTGAIKSMESGDFDFNDHVLSEFCRENNLMLVTDDSDFAKLDVDVITANQALVKNRI